MIGSIMVLYIFHIKIHQCLYNAIFVILHMKKVRSKSYFSHVHTHKVLHYKTCIANDSGDFGESMAEGIKLIALNIENNAKY